MANKEEIIVDGVDITECKYEYRGHCTIDFEKSNTNMLECKLCADNPNCYFKQYKHKELILNSIENYCKESSSRWLDLTAETVLRIINKAKE